MKVTGTANSKTPLAKNPMMNSAEAYVAKQVAQGHRQHAKAMTTTSSPIVVNYPPKVAKMDSGFNPQH